MQLWSTLVWKLQNKAKCSPKNYIPLSDAFSTEPGCLSMPPPHPPTPHTHMHNLSVTAWAHLWPRGCGRWQHSHECWLQCRSSFHYGSSATRGWWGSCLSLWRCHHYWQMNRQLLLTQCQQEGWQHSVYSSEWRELWPSTEWTGLEQCWHIQENLEDVCICGMR